VSNMRASFRKRHATPGIADHRLITGA
jgi:hypothetical protein